MSNGTITIHYPLNAIVLSEDMEAFLDSSSRNLLNPNSVSCRNNISCGQSLEPMVNSCGNLQGMYNQQEDTEVAARPFDSRSGAELELQAS